MFRLNIFVCWFPIVSMWNEQEESLDAMAVWWEDYFCISFEIVFFLVLIEKVKCSNFANKIWFSKFFRNKLATFFSLNSFNFFFAFSFHFMKFSISPKCFTFGAAVNFKVEINETEIFFRCFNIFLFFHFEIGQTDVSSTQRTHIENSLICLNRNSRVNFIDIHQRKTAK